MKHIILIGFKHTGKSVVGKMLSKKMSYNFFDLDNLLEKKHEKSKGEKLPCREIYNEYGKDYFRNLEAEVLKTVLKSDKKAVISVGGGTILSDKNREILSDHTIVHITAPRGIVYERIMVNGKPAFFPEDGDSLTSFRKIWDERSSIYEELADITVVNDESVENAVRILKDALLSI